MLSRDPYKISRVVHVILGSYLEGTLEAIPTFNIYA
jgi:hypothetical protein